MLAQFFFSLLQGVLHFIPLLHHGVTGARERCYSLYDLLLALVGAPRAVRGAERLALLLSLS